MKRVGIVLIIFLLVSGLFFVGAEEVSKAELPAAQTTGWEEIIQPLVEKIEILREEVFDIALWQYGLFALIVLVAVILSRIIDFFVIVRLKRLTAKTRTSLDDIAIEVMRKPLRLVIIIAGIILGLGVFRIPREAMAQLLGVLIGVVVTYTLIKLVDLFAAYLEPKVKMTESKLDDQLLPLIRKTLKVFIVAVGVMVILESLDLPVTSFLAGLGVGGLALALAAKETLANIFGSIAIFADKPFRVGERIIVDGCDGPVESIGMRSTRIRTLEGALVTIPNARLAEATINNVSRRPTIRNLYTIGITYDSGYDKMKKALEILRDIFKNHPSTENYWAYFKEFGSHSLNILVIHWCKRLVYEEFLKATEEINLDIMKRFEENSLEMAFPTQTLHLKGEEEKPA